MCQTECNTTLERLFDRVLDTERVTACLKDYLALPGFPTKNGMTSIAKMTYLPGFAKTQTGAAYGGSHPDEDFGA